MNPERARNRNLLLWSLLALIGLGFVLDQLGYLEFLQSGLQTILRPAQTLVLGGTSRVGDLTQPRQSLRELQTENETLRAEINRLQIENIQLQELERENQRLRELLNFTRNNPALDVSTAGVVGRIIGSDPSNLLYTIVIDVGVSDGIARDMAVINSRGLVGRVTRVGSDWAQVLLLVDPASSVNAVIQNSRVEGVVRGELGGTLIMERIPQGVTVSPGDLVLTSGLGGKIPPRLVIGQVVEVFQEDLELFQTARVRSTVDFGSVDSVLVVTAFQPIDFEPELLDELEEGN